MDQEKLAAGVDRCLAECERSDRPFSCVAHFVEALASDPNWTEQEILELQTRVVRVILRQHRQ
jgi:hypothetical protein